MNPEGGGPDNMTSFLVMRTFLERQLETKGLIDTRGGSLPVIFFKESHF